ncbi:MAG: PmoA family protein [Gemmatimonadota bacterium]|nr:PmoA family protein [Gemmatimonadota bacterium]
MSPRKYIIFLFTFLVCGCSGPAAENQMTIEEKHSPAYQVAITHNPAGEQIDVTVDGRPWTSYCYWGKLKKPVLFPLVTDDGRTASRGWPVSPVPGERVDHPHHFSCWFNYGDVNGDDFWNNSDAVDPKGRYGRIVHRSVDSLASGKNVAWCAVTMDWIASSGQGEKVIEEKDRIFFRAAPGLRIIDRVITLTALDRKVAFPDNKEGMLGLRVTRSLEEPSDRPLKLVDNSGKVTEVARLDNTGVDGKYLASSGLEGSGQVWGTRAKWCILRGTLEGKDATVGIFDHPDNVGYPTYWHARGYGLFAANPLGWKVFSGGKKELNFSLEPGASATWRFRILIASKRLEAGETENFYQQWLEDAGKQWNSRILPMAK